MPVCYCESSRADYFTLGHRKNLFLREILTCATQMTGCQPADTYNFPMYQQNNEVMEFTRIISQLAMANHQLVSAHNVTLLRIEALYLELSKNKQDQKNASNSSEIRDDNLRTRLSNTEEAVEREETRRLEQRVVRLERVLLATSSVEQCKQRRSRKDSKLHSRIERLENLLKIRDTKDRSGSVESHRESLDQQTNNIVIDAVNEVPDDFGDNERQRTREGMVDARYCNVYSDDSEMIVPRIEEISGSANIDKMLRRRVRSRDDEQNLRNLANEEIIRLSEEIKILKTDRLEYQNANERLLCNLTDQKTLMEKLNLDYEQLKANYVMVEDNLHKYKQKYDELTKHLDIAKGEIERLLKEIDIFQSEKNTAESRISILEKDLQKSLLDKEQIKNAENEKMSKLQAQLSKEVLDKKKQNKALEGALHEIQRLKEIMKTERNNEQYNFEKNRK